MWTRVRVVVLPPMSDAGGASVGGDRAQCAAAHSAIVQMREVSGQLSRAKSHLQACTRAVLLIVKHQDASLLSLAMNLVSWFEAQQYVVYVEEWLFRDVSPLCTDSASHPTQVRNWTVHASQTSPEGLVDLVVTLGGDGTVLFAASLFQKQVPPIAPFHLGTVGFLTTFDVHEHEKHLNSIIFERIRFCLRMRLSCIFDNGAVQQPPGSDCDSFQVLNEVVIDRGPSPFMCLLDIFCNGRLISSVQTDGLIIGTPTGSTAYSVSRPSIMFNVALTDDPALGRGSHGAPGGACYSHNANLSSLIDLSTAAATRFLRLGS